MIQSSPSSKVSQRTKILLVEDDPSIRDILSEVLGIEGYEVTAAENGRIGLQKLREIVDPTVVLLDLNMPIMSGWEFLAVKNEDRDLKNVPVIVLSAALSLPSSIPGSVAQLSKPIELQTLFGVLRKYAA